MDLIYMNERKEDIDVLWNFKFDLAYGIDENDFEVTVNSNNHVCKEGYFLYIEGTEYGGMIDRIAVHTDKNEIVYKGKTWHGILNKKILEPDEGEDHLILSGEMNSVLSFLISRMGLDYLFKASTKNSKLSVDNYKMDRYICGYDGISKMISSVGGKLKISFEEGYVTLSAEPLIDYSQDDEFDSSQIDFDIEKNYAIVNHLVCLGKGELKDRLVIHLYADKKGNISRTQSQFGINEIAEIYENVNIDNEENLEEEGIKFLKNLRDSDSLDVKFDSIRDYDIGDIVGAKENVTGIFVAKPIIKKIVTIKDGIVTIQHKVGE